jgi:hypothetical protein
VALHSVSKIERTVLSHDKMILYWLGGAGFVFKFEEGYIICVNPYLSDSVERLFGFRRLSIAPVKATQIACNNTWQRY